MPKASITATSVERSQQEGGLAFYVLAPARASLTNLDEKVYSRGRVNPLGMIMKTTIIKRVEQRISSKKGISCGAIACLTIVLVACAVAIHPVASALQPSANSPVLAQVTIDSDNALLSPNTQLVLNGAARQATVLSGMSTAVYLSSTVTYWKSWNSGAPLSQPPALAGAAINVSSGQEVNRFHLVGSAQVLAADPYRDRVIVIGKYRGSQTITLINGSRVIGSKPFTSSIKDPVYTVAAMDERQGHLLIAAQGIKQNDKSKIEHGVALINSLTGRLLRFSILPVEHRLYQKGTVSTPSLDCSIAVDPHNERGFLFDTLGNEVIVDTRTGRIVGTYLLPFPLRGAVADERQGHILALPNLGAPFCSGLHYRQQAVLNKEGRKAHIMVMLNARTGDMAHTVMLPIIPQSITIDDSDRQVVVTSDLDPAACFVDASTGKLKAVIKMPAPEPTLYTRHAIVDERRHRIIITSSYVVPNGLQTIVYVLNSRTASLLHKTSFPGFVESLVIDEHTGRLVVLSILSGQKSSHASGKINSMGYPKQVANVAIIDPMK